MPRPPILPYVSAPTDAVLLALLKVKPSADMPGKNKGKVKKISNKVVRKTDK